MQKRNYKIVAREKNMRVALSKPFRDRWGYETIDGPLYTTYEEAQFLLKEYRLAMPSHTVSISYDSNEKYL